MRRWSLLLLLPLACGCRPGAIWSPDGKQLALDPRGYLFTFDTATKQFKQHTRGPQKAVAPAWSPNGSRIAYYRLTSNKQAITGIDLMALDGATGKHSVLVPRLPTLAGGGLDGVTPPDFIRETLRVTWSPDGKRLAFLAFQGSDSTLWVANADGSGARTILTAPISAFLPSWSPDSSRIAFITTTEPPKEGNQPHSPGYAGLDVVNADGSGRRTLWDGKARETLTFLGPPPNWTADGKAVDVVIEREKKEGEFFGNASEIWRVPLAGEPAKLTTLRAPTAFLSFSASGAAYFPAPKDMNERAPSLAFAVPPYDSPKVFGRIDAEAVGAKNGEHTEIDTFPVPVLSPDARRIALSWVPKTGACMLLIQDTAGGPLQQFKVPFAAAAPVKKPAPKKPATRKKRAQRPLPAVRKQAASLTHYALRVTNAREQADGLAPAKRWDSERR
jgi:hypothetical protein